MLRILLLLIVLPWYALYAFIKWRLYRARVLSELTKAGVGRAEARELVGDLSPINFLSFAKS